MTEIERQDRNVAAGAGGDGGGGGGHQRGLNKSCSCVGAMTDRFPLCCKMSFNFSRKYPPQREDHSETEGLIGTMYLVSFHVCCVIKSKQYLL